MLGLKARSILGLFPICHETRPFSSAQNRIEGRGDGTWFLTSDVRLESSSEKKKKWPIKPGTTGFGL